MCQCCVWFGFDAVALATRVTTFPFPLSVSATTFSLYGHVPNNVLYAKWQRAQLYNNLLIENDLLYTKSLQEVKIVEFGLNSTLFARSKWDPKRLLFVKTICVYSLLDSTILVNRLEPVSRGLIQAGLASGIPSLWGNSQRPVTSRYVSLSSSSSSSFISLQRHTTTYCE